MFGLVNRPIATSFLDLPVGKQLFMFAPIRKSRKKSRRILVTANFANLQMADVSPWKGAIRLVLTSFLRPFKMPSPR